MTQKLTRRLMLKLAVLGSLGGVAAACQSQATQTSTPTRVPATPTATGRLDPTRAPAATAAATGQLDPTRAPAATAAAPTAAATATAETSREVARFTFGQIPTYQSDENFRLDVSDDKRALTLSFSDLQAEVGGGTSPTPAPPTATAIAPTSTRVFSLVLPLEGDEKRVEIEFFAQGYCFTSEGATATIVCSVNGQTTVTDFPGRSDQSYVLALKFAAETPSECRLCVFLLVGRDSRNANAAAYLDVLTIDAEILPRTQ